MLLQVLAQRDVIGEQNERCRDLEASTRQLEERCSELKEASGGHEARAREEAAEVLKGNRIIEKLTVRANAGLITCASCVCFPRNSVLQVNICERHGLWLTDSQLSQLSSTTDAGPRLLKCCPIQMLVWYAAGATLPSNTSKVQRCHFTAQLCPHTCHRDGVPAGSRQQGFCQHVRLRCPHC